MPRMIQPDPSPASAGSGGSSAPAGAPREEERGGRRDARLRRSGTAPPSPPRSPHAPPMSASANEQRHACARDAPQGGRHRVFVVSACAASLVQRGAQPVEPASGTRAEHGAERRGSRRISVERTATARRPAPASPQRRVRRASGSSASRDFRGRDRRAALGTAPPVGRRHGERSAATRLAAPSRSCGGPRRAVSAAGMNEAHGEARMVIVEMELAIVEMRHRSRKRQPQARCRAASGCRRGARSAPSPARGRPRECRGHDRPPRSSH